MNIKFLLFSGKNPKWVYYVKNFVRIIIPNIYYRNKLNRYKRAIEKRKDSQYILERVKYYNKLNQHTSLSEPQYEVGSHTYKNYKNRKEFTSVYFFDSYEFTRYFKPSLKWSYCMGDVTYVPNSPSIVKSRPISDSYSNSNSVVMKLEKIRHFIFVNDTIPFSKKKDVAVFRGKIDGKQNRIDFMNKFFGNPQFNCGIVDKSSKFPDKWRVEKLTLNDHLQNKFIMCLEGNDVASNLKWVMSSNSIAVSPKMKYETWFMEGKLIPNYHYIEVKDDFSDLEEKLDYYAKHEDEAQEIINHANEYVKQFFDEEREKLISIAVLNKFFEMTQDC